MLTGTRILLIDNDDGMRKSLSLFFQNRCNLVHTFENGNDAICFLGLIDYDLILCDANLPDLPGLDVIHAISKRYLNAVKILMTSYGNYVGPQDISAAGIDYVLVKPFSGDSLEKILTQLAREKKIVFKNLSINTFGSQSNTSEG